MFCPVSFIARQSIVRPMFGRMYCSLLNGGKCPDLKLTLQNNSISAVVYTIPCRTLVRKPEREDMFGKTYRLEADMRDRIPPGYKIAYVAPTKLLTIGFKAAYVILILIFGYSLKTEITQYMEHTEADEYEEKLPLLYDLERLVPKVLLGISLVCLAMLLYASRSMLLRLYYNKKSNNFIAVIGKHALYKYQLNFKPSDVKVVELFASSRGGFVEVNKKSLTVAEKGFVNPELLNKFMGFSKSQPGPHPSPVKRGIFVPERGPADDGEREPDGFIERIKRKRRLSMEE